MKCNRAMNKFRRAGHGKIIRWKSKVYHLQNTPLFFSCSILITPLAKGNRLKINTNQYLHIISATAKRLQSVGTVPPNLSYHFPMIWWSEGAYASEDNVSLLRAEALAPHHHPQFSSVSEHGCSLCFFLYLNITLGPQMLSFYGHHHFFPLFRTTSQHPSFLSNSSTLIKRKAFELGFSHHLFCN